MEECDSDVQWCVRSFEMFVIGSWSIAVNLDGISLLTQC